MLRKLLGTAGVSSLLIASALSAASAADLAPTPAYKAPPPPPPVYSWTGCYIDGGIGYGMYNQNSHSETDPGLVAIGAPVTNGGEGWLGRLGGGCDYQFGAGGLGNFVIGAFADYDFTDLKGTFGDPSGSVTGSETERGAWHAGGRLGYLLTPSLLTYVDGGYTEARVGAINFLTAIGGPTPISLVANTYHGWFLGGGYEYALTMPWVPIRGLFWRTEYRYDSYQSADIPIIVTATGAPFGVAEHIRADDQTITSGLVWRFNWPGR